jgi:hypothetical protein
VTTVEGMTAYAKLLALAERAATTLDESAEVGEQENLLEPGEAADVRQLAQELRDSVAAAHQEAEGSAAQGSGEIGSTGAFERKVASVPMMRVWVDTGDGRERPPLYLCNHVGEVETPEGRCDVAYSLSGDLIVSLHPEDQATLTYVIHVDDALRHAMAAAARMREGERVRAKRMMQRDEPECPGEHCPMCNGEYCSVCVSPGSDNPCEHDVIERHEKAGPVTP